MFKKVVSILVRIIFIVIFLAGTLLTRGHSLPIVHAVSFWYVDANIFRPGDGTSWAAAFKNLQPAIDAASAGDTIRVAQGVYYPTTVRLNTDPRTKSFILKDGVQILGGYDIATQTREPSRFPTILSGDLDKNDYNKDGNFINETWESEVGENAYNVVFGENLSNTTILDGFIITGGFADYPGDAVYQHGGGLHITGGAPILRNLLVSGNTALYYRHHGGGMHFEEASSATVESSVIRGNFAYSGGGLEIYSGCNITIRDTIIRDNFARALGGGISTWDASLNLDNVKVIKNTGRDSGGLDAYKPPSVIMNNVEFSENIGGGISLGMYSGTGESFFKVTNGKFSGNYGNDMAGGAMTLSNVTTELVNVLFDGNYSSGSGGAIDQNHGTLTATNVTLAGNNSGRSGSAVNLGFAEAVTFNNSILWDNNVYISFSNGVYPVYNFCYQDIGGSSNPGFVNPLPRESAPTIAGDYHLTADAISQVLNAGNSSYLPVEVTTDLDGNRRLVGLVDLGPYEYQPIKVGYSEFIDSVSVDPGGYFKDFLEPSTFVLPKNEVYDPFPQMISNLSEIADETKGGIIYVDQNATGAGNGTSWADAYTDLEPALRNTQSGDEIWVAEGVYIPSNQIDPSLIYSKTFLLPNGVSIYGGFAGTETTRDQRDWNTNPTILSGDLDGNDENSDGNFISEHPSHLNGINAGHVVTANKLSATTVLDGFIITGGMASMLIIGEGGSYIGEGGGVWIYKSPDVQLMNMQFYGNAAVRGGAVYAYYHSNLTIDNSIFEFNYGGEGPAIQINKDSQLTLTNSKLQNNFGSNNGGAIYVFDYGSANIQNSSIENNGQVEGVSNPSLSGGAIMMYFDCQATIDRSDFLNNSAPHTGGIYLLNYNHLTLTNSRLQGNDAYETSGGALYLFNSNLDMVNVLITGNHTARRGGAIHSYANGGYDQNLINITNSTITGNLSDSSSYTNGIDLSATEVNLLNSIMMDYYDTSWNSKFTKLDSYTFGDPMFRDPVDRSLAPTSEGDYRLLPGSPVINSGNNDLVPPGIDLDLAGGLRIQQEVVDIGAYEYQPIIYVDQNASGSNNGGNWAHAYTDLQDALLEATAPQQIWVADGLYKPTDTDDRSISFALKSGVHLFGGFAGTESDLLQRLPSNPPSVLSGDLEGNDLVDSNGIRTYAAAVNETNSEDNSYHVVFCEGNTEQTILDGFTITAGHANVNTSLNQSGGGILVNNCGQNLWMSNLDFVGNSAYWGGAVNNQASSPIMMQLDIRSNSAYEGGGGVYNATDSNPTIRESSMRGNTAVYGGAIYNFENKNTIVNSLFSGNLSTQAGGGIYNNSSSPEFINVTLVSNYSAISNSGGGIYNLGSNSKVKFINSILYGNFPTQYSNDGGVMAVTYSDIQGGHFGTGNIDADPSFVNPGTANNKPSIDGDYHLNAFSPCVDTGLNDAVGSPIRYLKDLDGFQRIFDGDENSIATVDMGAYEYQQNTLTVEIVGNGDVTKTPDKLSYTTGEEVTLTATADPGWTFSGWSGDGTGSDNPLIVTIDGNTTLTATFTKNEYTINLLVDPEGKGSISSNPSGIYEYNQQVELIATPSPGWQFKQWRGDVTSTENPLTVTVTNNLNILAEFEKVGYTISITIDPEGYGTVNLNPQKDFYALDEQVTLTATALDDWSFLGWSGDLLSTQSSIVVNVSGDLEINANFGTPPPPPTFEVFLPLLTK
jgi:uncharacterized repeat protein (TIGR02543 family)